ncbi:hypothetical protein [Paraburkholderia sp. C35]|uniref:hypothetical protein n=1 Tax=Paraburkholderia sp. C35 TaxID=2126993 RepID=UPI000D68A92F|nr:hypothetical protein [Paraburkholderia sp. C35]
MLKKTIIATALLVASALASAAPFTFSPALMHSNDGKPAPVGPDTFQGFTIGKSLLSQAPDCTDPQTYHAPFKGSCFAHRTGSSGAVVIAAPGLSAHAVAPGADQSSLLGYHAPTIVDTQYYEDNPRLPRPVHVVITSLPATDQTAQKLVTWMAQQYGNPSSVTPTEVTWTFQDLEAKVVYGPEDVALNVPSAGPARVLYAEVYDTAHAGNAQQLLQEFGGYLFNTSPTK